MSISIQIRPCTSKDLGTLSQVANAAYQANYSHFWEDDGKEYMAEYLSVETLQEELEDFNCMFFLVEDKSSPIGFFKINIHQSLGNTSPLSSLELERIYLLSRYTGRGVGKKCLEFTTKWAKKRNKKIIWTKVMEQSAARSFYQKTGFVFHHQHTLEYPLIKENFNVIYTLYKLIS